MKESLNFMFLKSHKAIRREVFFSVFLFIQRKLGTDVNCKIFSIIFGYVSTVKSFCDKAPFHNLLSVVTLSARVLNSPLQLLSVVTILLLLRLCSSSLTKKLIIQIGDSIWISYRIALLSFYFDYFSNENRNKLMENLFMPEFVWLVDCS